MSVVAFGFIFQNAPLLLLAGAVGGMLARLRKAVKIKTSVFDYGVAWPVLFLTPFTGALAGWTGVAMLYTLHDSGVLISPNMPINLFDVNLFTTLAALMFGMSATLFDRFIEKMEVNVSGDRRAAASTADLSTLINEENLPPPGNGQHPVPEPDQPQALETENRQQNVADSKNS